MRNLNRSLLAAVVVAGLLGSLACADSNSLRAPAPVSGGVLFAVEAASAKSVALAGSFNQWSPSAHPLRRQGSSSVWARVVPLAPGEHQFMYVIDATRWMSPPLAEDYVDDGFGTKNGLVIVK